MNKASNSYFTLLFEESDVKLFNDGVAIDFAGLFQLHELGIEFETPRLFFKSRICQISDDYFIFAGQFFELKDLGRKGVSDHRGSFFEFPKSKLVDEKGGFQEFHVTFLV